METQNQTYLRIYCTVYSPAFVKFLGYSETDFVNENYFVILTEYMEKGSLSNVFKRLNCNKIPKGWTNTIMVINILGISLGLKHLHQNNFIHLNIKPSKILLDSDFYPKIGNFHFAKYIDKDTTKRPYLIGTLNYTPPEVLSDATESNLKCSVYDYAFKIDVYSFGMILYKFFAKYRVFISGSAFDHSSSVLQGFRPDNSKLAEGPIKELIMRCWSEDPDERPSFDEIIKHYTKDREIFWPQDVDEEEVENYLKKFD